MTEFRFLLLFSTLLLGCCLRSGPIAAAEAKRVHATAQVSTLARDDVSYYTGDAEAFNQAIFQLAEEFPAEPSIVTTSGVVSSAPAISVHIYPGTGLCYLKKCRQYELEEQNKVIDFVPLIPAEIRSGKLAPFEFDWMVLTSSRSPAGKRQATVVLFVDGNVDRFDCRLPDNVALKIGKTATIETEANTRD